MRRSFLSLLLQHLPSLTLGYCRPCDPDGKPSFNIMQCVCEYQKKCPMLQVPLKWKNSSERHIAVFDLDSTLVHYADQTNAILLAPGVVPFLREIRKLFNVVLWTAGIHGYGEMIHSAIEKFGQSLDGHAVLGDLGTIPILTREHTITVAGSALNYTKHLALLGAPSLSRVVIIDDSTRSFLLTPRNAIRVPGWWFAPTQQLDGVGEFTVDMTNVSGRHESHMAPNTFLVDRVLPVLRHVAGAPSVDRELDHWRSPQYDTCDELEVACAAQIMFTAAKHFSSEELYVFKYWQESFIGSIASKRSDVPAVDVFPSERYRTQQSAAVAMKMLSTVEGGSFDLRQLFPGGLLSEEKQLEAKRRVIKRCAAMLTAAPGTGTSHNNCTY